MGKTEERNAESAAAKEKLEKDQQKVFFELFKSPSCVRCNWVFGCLLYSLYTTAPAPSRFA